MSQTHPACEGPVAGVDGCRGGWVAVRWEADGPAGVHLARTFGDLGPLLAGCARVLVDMPIGLPTAERPVRACDQAARRRLGWPRSATVFSPPCTEAAEADDYATALRANRAVTGRGLSQQAYGLGPKILEVAQALATWPPEEARPVESHPELCWQALFPDRSLPSKHKPEGVRERLDLLEPLLGRPGERRPRRVAGVGWGQADLADAGVLALAARSPCEELGGPALAGLPAYLLPQSLPATGIGEENG
jgi:predicted RNase H-like nuclease